VIWLEFVGLFERVFLLALGCISFANNNNKLCRNLQRFRKISRPIERHGALLFTLLPKPRRKLSAMKLLSKMRVSLGLKWGKRDFGLATIEFSLYKRFPDRF